MTKGTYLLRHVWQAECCKKEWLRQRFDDGLVFYRSEERGKCFIEYIPAENAWVPIAADGYLYINCLWVSGSMKDTDTRMICWRRVSVMPKRREERYLYSVYGGPEAGISR